MFSHDLVSDIFSDLTTGYEFNPVIGCAIRFFLRNPYESTLIIDKNGCVQYMEKASERFLGLEPGEAKGMDVSKLIPDSALPSVLKTGKPIVGRIFEVRGVKRIGAVYPLKIRGEIVGGLGKIIFQNLVDVENINNEIQVLKKEVQHFKQKEQKEHSSVYTFDNILGESKTIKEAIETAKNISNLNIDVMILGESGTGKELFAHSIHSASGLNKPFVKINCPAIPFELAESELFGYEKGAFTGALPFGKEGYFETANNGTAFLDEISTLPLSIQAKLLRVLEEREIKRLGSTKAKTINFRVVSATNIDLKNLLNEGKFRQDLYYRVAKAIIYIPPLRDRREDIPIYIDYFIKKISQSFKMQPKTISDKAMDILYNYYWPGNVRELINVLDQTIIKASNDKEIRAEHLPSDIPVHAQKPHHTEVPENTHSIKQEITEAERNLITSALRQTNGNKRKAAILLSMPRSTLYEKIKRHNIRPDL
ncbi:MAG: sigma 54-interacting transcriptional regulator [Syntrophorhabdaceae bacterium]|nr:sigma 54-interacting transcriptional regulator [Syntrophorhabdaceae bacterium]MDD5242797.1 sigma 54-interacting transcriptional regulator [Syntrophorhabdaceae bacterium]